MRIAFVRDSIIIPVVAGPSPQAAHQASYFIYISKPNKILLELQGSDDDDFTPNNTTFYRRQLPQTVVSFSSNEGRHIFSSALAHGGTRAFFALIEQL